MQASVDYNGKKEFVKMGSYGIGVSRLVGAIIEAKFDEKKEIMKWPMSISPYHCAILPLINKTDNTKLDIASNLLKELQKNQIDAIIDDTDESISSKIKKFNLIGIPFQIVIGNNFNSDKIEFLEVGIKTHYISLNEIIKKLKKKIEN